MTNQDDFRMAAACSFPSAEYVRRKDARPHSQALLSGRSTSLVAGYFRYAIFLGVVLLGGCSALHGQTGSSSERHSLKDLRDQYVVKQQMDYSCGAASLATLMKYYYGDDTSEKEILDLLNLRLNNLPKEEVERKRKAGFSLLDLKMVAQQKGYQAAGFELKPERLRQLAAPVIVFLRPLGYSHFAVLRGMVGNKVYLADPARGNLRFSMSRFLDEYGGVIFALGRPGEKDITQYPLDFERANDYPEPMLYQMAHRSDEQAAAAVNATVTMRPH